MNKILKIFFKARKGFTTSKVWVQRSMSYIAIANSAMILFLLLSRLEDYGIEVNIAKWFFPILIIGILLMVLIGYIDDKLGFYREEHREVSRRNPYLVEIIERLDKIEKGLNTIKKKRK